MGRSVHYQCLNHVLSSIGLLIIVGCGGGDGGITDVMEKPHFLFPDTKDIYQTEPNYDPFQPELGFENVVEHDFGIEIVQEAMVEINVSKCQPDGTPCDDKDPCTINDMCQSGHCVGQPFPCPDDGVPCTKNTCVNGQCKNVIVQGYCLIQGICYTDGQKDPLNGCRVCASLVSQTDWTYQENAICDDGDPCTYPDICQGGKCTPGDNTCIEVPPKCTFHEDCYPEKVCGLWYKDNTMRCSKMCGGMADCGKGETCTGMPGSANLGYCQPFPKENALQVGDGPCNTGWDCQSALCLESKCGTVCSGQIGCGFGYTCQPAGDLVLGFGGACFPDTGNNLFSIGSQCTKDGSIYDSSLCKSGHCDLFMSKPLCAPLCWTDAQCAPNQECNIVLYSTQPISESVPYAKAFQTKTHDAILGCFTQQPGGGKIPTGSVCTKPSDCKTSKCMALKPNDPTKYCTTFCVRDSDCPETMKCKLDVVNLVSVWLANNTYVGGQPMKPDSYTLIGVCKPK